MDKVFLQKLGFRDHEESQYINFGSITIITTLFRLAYGMGI